MFFKKSKKRKLAFYQVRLSGKEILNIDKKFLKDSEICIEAIKTWAAAFQYIDKSLKNNKSFCYRALCNNTYVFKYLPVKMRREDSIIKRALISDIKGENFNFLPADLKQKEEYAYITFMKDMRIYPRLCKRLRKSIYFYTPLACEGWNFVRYFPKEKLSTELCDLLATFHSEQFIFVKDLVSLKTVKTLYESRKISIKDIPFKYLSKFLKSEEESLLVLKENPEAIGFIPKKFLTDFVIKQYFSFIENTDILEKICLKDFFNIPLELLIKYNYKKIIYNLLKKENHYSYNNQEMALFLLKISSDFLDFFYVTNETLFEAVKYNDEILNYIMDKKFKEDLEDALINNSLENFKENHSEYFFKDYKRILYYNSLIRNFRELEKIK